MRYVALTFVSTLLLPSFPVIAASQELVPATLVVALRPDVRDAKLQIKGVRTILTVQTGSIRSFMADELVEFGKEYRYTLTAKIRRGDKVITIFDEEVKFIGGRNWFVDIPRRDVVQPPFFPNEPPLDLNKELEQLLKVLEGPSDLTDPGRKSRAAIRLEDLSPQIVPDPPTAKRLQEIYLRADAGYAVFITRALGNMGVPLPKKK